MILNENTRMPEEFITNFPQDDLMNLLNSYKDYLQKSTKATSKTTPKSTSKTASKTTSKKSKKSKKNFYKTPSKIGSKSIIKDLADEYGVEQGGVKTFKTSLICATKSLDYNGVLISIRVIGTDNILLIVKSNDNEKIMGNWKVDDITSTYNTKNTIKMTSKQIVELIEKGELGVKFNKSVSKDHGTMWRFKKTSK